MNNDEPTQSTTNTSRGASIGGDVKAEVTARNLL
jgi:hypothetical protein